ncbi:ATP-binding protein [Streptomyces sp. NPDC002851]
MKPDRTEKPSADPTTAAAPGMTADAVIPVPRAPEGLAAVRRHAAEVLRQWQLPPDRADDALLVTSELLTNAVAHALPPASLRLSRQGVDDRAVRIEVTDAGPAPAGSQNGSRLPPEESGRGSVIIAALSARSGTRTWQGGAARWAEIRTSAP